MAVMDSAMAERFVAVVGKESAGKSQLISSLTGRAAYTANFRGATVSCEVYRADGRILVDTPGIFRGSDTLTTRMALERMDGAAVLLLVIPATNIDEDLHDLLPLVKDKAGIVAVTFWDKLELPEGERSRQLKELEQACGVPVVAVDSRKLTGDQKVAIFSALDAPSAFQRDVMPIRLGWQVVPRRTPLEYRVVGPALAMLLLLLPAILAVWVANGFAGAVDPAVQRMVASLVQALSSLPSLPREVLIGSYGIVTMGPLLFVWAVPTVILYAFGLGFYKASGLLDRLTTAIQPMIGRFGLTGRDLVRVMMGFGCNVPAVINTRACSSCSRATTISAIAFGSACSYQLGATLAVFGATGHPGLVLPYLLYLAITTLIFLRMTAPPLARSPLNILMAGKHTFLTLPRWQNIWREAMITLRHFFRTAVPIFFVITIIAAVLSWLGVVKVLADFFAPAMKLFNLPAEAALPVILSSIRKDGLLLWAQQESVHSLSAVQILTGVYLAGVLLPCLVTALTIAREQSFRFVIRLMARQAFAASIFALVIAWAGVLLWPS